MSDRDDQNPICFMSACDIAAGLARGDFSSVDVVDAYIAQIDRVEPSVNAFVTVTAEQARAAAVVSDRRRSSGSALGRLEGIPIAVKDLTPTAGVRTTYGSSHYAQHVPDSDSLAWARLKAEGAILLGKTTTPEFGWLGVTESRLTGVTRNPWDLDRTAAGSSGGSAVAVAAGMSPLSTGSDGSGSVRMPASVCGVVGMKPSTGRIPYYGEEEVFADTASIGPLTRTTADAALMLGVMAGPDEREPFSVGPVADYVAGLEQASIRGRRVAFAPTLGGFKVDPSTAAVVQGAAARFEHDLGAVVEEVDVDILDPLEHLLRFHLPALAAFIEDLQASGYRLDNSHPTLGTYARRGHEISGVTHFRATIPERGRLHEQIATVFLDHDFLLTPTMPLTAFPHPGDVGGPTEIAGVQMDDPVLGFQWFCAPFNMTGHPAITVPCGFDESGLPVGLQIVGKHGADAAVLAAAAAFERAHPWSGRRPPHA